MGAAYDVSIDMTSSETFLFPVEPVDAAGNPPVWADYEITYRLWGCGTELRLTEGNGIQIDELNDIILVGPTDRAYRLPPGQYQHGMLMKQLSTGITVQDFEGAVSVSKGA